MPAARVWRPDRPMSGTSGLFDERTTTLSGRIDFDRNDFGGRKIQPISNSEKGVSAVRRQASGHRRTGRAGEPGTQSGAQLVSAAFLYQTGSDSSFGMISRRISSEFR